MGRKKWNVCKLNKNLASEIAEQYSIDPFAALLLVERGFTDKEQLDDFFDTDESLMDPFLLPDMQKAVDRINSAVFDYELICVFGDYDADGVTATTLLYSYLEAQGANVTYLLPDRREDGYGLSRGIADKIKALGTSLIITVDNGISAVEEAEYIRELGMDMVITDHHLEGEELPKCAAVVDPHRRDCSCPYEDYAGVGVAFKLCCALEGSDERVLSAFGDIAAIGTIADLVPLTGENRKIVKSGLRAINEFPRPGVEALLRIAKLDGKTVQSSNVAFGIGPRINAAGRMEHPDSALDLLLADEPEEAANLAEHVNQLNVDRHKAEEQICREAEVFLKNNPEFAHEPVIVVSGEGWHEGVLGIVASKIAEKYLRPAIVLSQTETVCRGSARSVEGFSIYDAIRSCRGILNAFGGHELAAGLSLDADKIDEFRKSINEYAYNKRRVYPETSIDVKLNPASISVGLLDSIETLEPFGTSNQSPVFGLFGMTIESVSALGTDGQHKRLSLYRPGKIGRVTALKFHSTDFCYSAGDRVDLIVTLNRNEFNGRVSVSVIIKDIRPASADDDQMVTEELLYDRIMAGRRLSAAEAQKAIPDRQVFAAVYRFLQTGRQLDTGDYEYICMKAGYGEEDLCRIRVALEAMRELGLTAISPEGRISISHVDGKVTLTEAPIIKKLQKLTN